jgi:adenosylcobinamide-GDP ribazoletransferase
MLRPLLIGLQFLTRLPIRTQPGTSRDIAASYFFYPVIGFLIGLAAVLLRRSLTTIFPESFAVVAALAFLVWITGGLHEDGLADAADGLGGGWTHEQSLDIMKDSRIGTFGALMIVFIVLAKYAALTSMPPDRADRAIITAQMLGRWAFLPLGYFNPSARDGLGAEFMKGLHATTITLATIASVAGVTLLSRGQGIAAFCGTCAIVAAASAYFRRRLGGVTGDCFGAAFQFVEVATYAVFLA